MFDFAADSGKRRMAAVKSLPGLHHSKMFIFIFFRITEPILILRNRALLKPVVWGAYSPANYMAVYEESQSNRDSDFHSFICLVVPRATIYIL